METVQISKAVDAPLELSNKLEEAEAAVLIIDLTNQRYVEQAVKKAIDLEVEKNKPVQKILVKKENESKERFQDRAEEKTREQAEKLAHRTNKKEKTSTETLEDLEEP
ncbi:MAG: hypothetical protein ABEJ93_00860 [Candidatus Nanohalobium sp.]